MTVGLFLSATLLTASIGHVDERALGKLFGPPVAHSMAIDWATPLPDSVAALSVDEKAGERAVHYQARVDNDVVDSVYVIDKAGGVVRMAAYCAGPKTCGASKNRLDLLSAAVDVVAKTPGDEQASSLAYDAFAHQSLRAPVALNGVVVSMTMRGRYPEGDDVIVKIAPKGEPTLDAGDLPPKGYIVVPGILQKPSFWLMAHEVSAGEYDACVREAKCTPAHVDDGTCSVTDERGESKRGVVAAHERGAAMPVVCVDQKQAAAYCADVGARLPTTDELGQALEHARVDGAVDAPCLTANVADASAKRAFPAWSTYACDDGHARAGVACTGRRDALGFCDLLGNVWEWTASGKNDAAVDVFGGSWDYEHKAGRDPERTQVPAKTRDGSIGVRCARTRP